MTDATINHYELTSTSEPLDMTNGYVITNLDDELIVAGVTHRITNDTYMTPTDLCTAIDTALNATGITCTYSTGTGLYTFRSAAAFTLQANSTLLAFIGFDDIDNVASPVYATYAISSLMQST